MPDSPGGRGTTPPPIPTRRTRRAKVTKLLWEKLRLPAADENRVWELFHENSKAGRHDSFLSQEEIVERMNLFQECFGYDQYPAFDLPGVPAPVPLALDEAIRRRASCQEMRPCVLPLD